MPAFMVVSVPIPYLLLMMGYPAPPMK